MDNIRQLNASHSITLCKWMRIRRMLLAMVGGNFRCVIIKLAERITFLRDAEYRCAEEDQSRTVKNVLIFMPLCQSV